MPRRRLADHVLIGALALLMLAALATALFWPDFFSRHFTTEDAFVENLTAIGLALGGAALFSIAVARRRALGTRAAILPLLYAALFVWAAGEEVSWGQRILDYETGPFMEVYNDQDEVNLHNLVVGGVKLDEVLFGPVMSALILSWLLFLPFLWRAFPAIRRLAARMAAPVPGRHHALAALMASLVIVMIDASRKWEVYEAAFALLSLAIFLRPANDAELRPSGTGGGSTGSPARVMSASNSTASRMLSKGRAGQRTGPDRPGAAGRAPAPEPSQSDSHQAPSA